MVQLGRYRLDETERCEIAECLFRPASAQDLVIFLQQPRRRASRNFGAMPVDGREDIRIDSEVKACRQGDGAHHSDRILPQADIWITNRPDHAGPKIAQAADIVDNRECRDVIEESVDGEVTSEGGLFGRCERVVVVDQVRLHRSRHAVLYNLLARLDLPAKRSDLDNLWPESDVRQAKTPADDPAIAKEPLDLIGVGRRADIEVFRTAAEQKVPDAAAHEVCDVIELPQTIEHFERVGIDIAA